MPHDEQAERVLLAGLMRERELVLRACEYSGVVVGDLYFHAHQLVWGAIWEGANGAAEVYRGLWLDGVLLELGLRPALWLADVLDEDPTGAWCYTACRTIKDTSRRRDVIHKAREAIRDAM